MNATSSTRGILLLLLLAIPLAVQAQEDAGKEANNPLANMTAVNFQNYFIPEFTGAENAANQFLVRYAKPFRLAGDWLMRATVPVNTYPVGPNATTRTGLGDVNAFAAYLIDTGNPSLSVGVGPQLTIPTATSDGLGSDKWSAGFAHVLFNGNSSKIQWGYLLTWQHSFAGDDDGAPVNLGAFQPFVFYQLGGGTYLRYAGVWAYDFENDGYTIPIGLGIGKVIPQGKTVYNVFIEPQISVFDRGRTWPQWQVFVGFNMQFLGS